jgi:outer membrane protein OmpA-like peptidoglycan-associated protein
LRHRWLVLVATFLCSACGGAQTAGPEPGSGPSPAGESPAGSPASDEDAPAEGEFQLQESDTAGQARGEHPSEIEATPTHAAMRLFVVNADSGPVQGIVIKLTAPDGTEYFTGETDSHGYAEVLVPAGQRYEIEYLSLGRRNTMAHVDVPDGPNQDIRLTMRYRRVRPAPPVRAATPESAPPAEPEPRRFVLDGVLFETASATIQAESFPRLDRVVEYLTHRPSARIRISGHTDNVGNPHANQALSEARAEAVREYMISHGVDADRVEAVGVGDREPVAPNDTDDGRRQNRRIEATEL